MGQANSHGATDLAPELSAKLRQVEQDIEKIEEGAGRRIRWRWLSVIPHLAQIFALLGVFGYMIGAVLFIIARQSGATLGDPLLQALRYIGGVVGCGLALLIATWASRYCDAKGEGRL